MENIKKKNDGGPAFPWCNPNPGVATGGDGMTLRDYFAAMAMGGLCACPSTNNWTWDEIADESYSLADVMIKVREKI